MRPEELTVRPLPAPTLPPFGGPSPIFCLGCNMIDLIIDLSTDAEPRWVRPAPFGRPDITELVIPRKMILNLASRGLITIHQRESRGSWRVHWYLISLTGNGRMAAELMMKDRMVMERSS